MGNETCRVVKRFWALMQSNDFHSVAEVLHREFELIWPQSGERIVGAWNFGELNRNYPAKGKWSFVIERLVADGEHAVTDVVVTDGDINARAVSFFTLKEGLIYRITEYWPDPFEAAEWRREWITRD